MGNQIIKQPNGFFAIFDSGSDTIALWDCTEDDVVEYFVDMATADAKKVVRMQIDHVKDGHPREAYFQFAMTWEEALELDGDNGGSVKVDYAHEEARSSGGVEQEESH